MPEDRKQSDFSRHDLLIDLSVGADRQIPDLCTVSYFLPGGEPYKICMADIGACFLGWGDTVLYTDPATESR